MEEKAAVTGQIGVGLFRLSSYTTSLVRDANPRPTTFDKMRGRRENRHIGLKRRTVYRALDLQ